MQLKRNVISCEIEDRYIGIIMKVLLEMKACVEDVK